MEFLVSPPEVNSLRVYAGVGSGSIVAAVAAWDELAANLQSAAASFGLVTSGLSGGLWHGPSSTAMRETAAPYVAWLGAAGTQAGRAAAQARVTVGAFETTFAATVHPAASRAIARSCCRWRRQTCSGRTLQPSRRSRPSMSTCGPRTWPRWWVTTRRPQRPGAN
jgi:PPE-repeat protein